MLRALAHALHPLHPLHPEHSEHPAHLFCRYALCADLVTRPAADAAKAGGGAQAVELRGGMARVTAAESEKLRYRTLMKSLVGTAVWRPPRPCLMSSPALTPDTDPTP